MTTATRRYHLGQLIYRGKMLYGVVSEVDDVNGFLIVNLHRTAYSGSDAFDDAGIPAGTAMKQGLVCYIQIAGDPGCQVPTYQIIDDLATDQLEPITDEQFQALCPRH